MEEIDKKIMDIFYRPSSNTLLTKFMYGTAVNDGPHLEDIFRVAKEEEIHCTMMSQGVINFHREMALFEDIPYNPTISLLAQTDETKKELIKLFS